MAPRSQPFRLNWPLTPDQLEWIDTQFQELYDDLRNGSLLPLTTRGDLVTHDGTDAVRLPIGDPNTVLRTDGLDPEWDKVHLDSDVDETLPVANGGTGVVTWTPYAVVAGGTTPTGPLQQVSGVGTSTQVLTSNGAGALPTWEDGPLPAEEQGYWSPLTNGDAAAPELVFDGVGDTIAVWTAL